MTSARALESWKADYIAEYLRTSGQRMTIGPTEPGGWMTVVSTHGGATPSQRESRMRKSQVIAATQVLRGRPDFEGASHAE
jgi:hypothetical protein